MKPSVLIVDHSLTVRMSLAASFESSGFATTLCDTVAAAREVLARSRFDLALLELHLADGSGVALLRELRASRSGPAVPVLLLCSEAEGREQLSGAAAERVGFAEKDRGTHHVLARALQLVAAPDRLPAAPLPAAPAGACADAVRQVILAVDDSPTYRHALSDQLRAAGFEVVPACSGSEALELLAGRRVDCILLDLLMPGLSGQETCHLIRRNEAWREIPLLMLTSQDEPGSTVAGIEAGADDYVAKAGEFEVLLARVRAQLRRRRLEEQYREVREQLHRREAEAAEARAARRIAEARAALVDELERKNHELEAFNRSVSHDLRAPLRAIDALGAMLLQQLDPVLTPGPRRDLQELQRSVAHMRSLIDSLLQLSRIGITALDRRPVDLTTLARSILDSLALTDPQRCIETSVQEGLVANADPPLLRVALTNLLENAWKFTGRTPRPQIAVGWTGAGRYPTYYVQDNGVGFEPAHANRLFEPFQRLHPSTEFPGNGIGLTTVERIVTRHGGRVWAESAAGRETTFFFTLA